ERDAEDAAVTEAAEDLVSRALLLVGGVELSSECLELGLHLPQTRVHFRLVLKRHDRLRGGCLGGRRSDGRSFVTGRVTVRCLPRWNLLENGAPTRVEVKFDAARAPCYTATVPQETSTAAAGSPSSAQEGRQPPRIILSWRGAPDADT